jgi:gamma-glutamylcyclotransferase (GGCT)/AIG2-like uncharacterized protein YtfP
VTASLLYAAYGSNLDPARLRGRCPGAAQVGTGWLSGWRLVVNRFASIVPDPGARVPLGLWRITADDLVALDRAEGFRAGRPAHRNAYDRRLVEVETAHGATPCLTYVELDTRPGPPTAGYVAFLRTGYAHFGFDPAPLDAALAASGFGR